MRHFFHLVFGGEFMEINKKTYDNNNPWLYANYSLLIPGLGQIIRRKLKSGITFLVIFSTLLILLSFSILSENVNGGVIIVVLSLTIIVYLWNIINALKSEEKNLDN